jgi:hypothetical protein
MRLEEVDGGPPADIKRMVLEGLSRTALSEMTRSEETHFLERMRERFFGIDWILDADGEYARDGQSGVVFVPENSISSLRVTVMEIYNHMPTRIVASISGTDESGSTVAERVVVAGTAVVKEDKGQKIIVFNASAFVTGAEQSGVRILSRQKPGGGQHDMIVDVDGERSVVQGLSETARAIDGWTGLPRYSPGWEIKAITKRRPIFFSPTVEETPAALIRQISDQEPIIVLGDVEANSAEIFRSIIFTRDERILMIVRDLDELRQLQLIATRKNLKLYGGTEETLRGYIEDVATMARTRSGVRRYHGRVVLYDDRREVREVRDTEDLIEKERSLILLDGATTVDAEMFPIAAYPNKTLFIMRSANVPSHKIVETQRGYALVAAVGNDDLMKNYMTTLTNRPLRRRGGMLSISDTGPRPVSAMPVGLTEEFSAAFSHRTRRRLIAGLREEALLHTGRPTAREVTDGMSAIRWFADELELPFRVCWALIREMLVGGRIDTEDGATMTVIDDDDSNWSLGDAGKFFVGLSSVLALWKRTRSVPIDMGRICVSKDDPLGTFPGPMMSYRKAEYATMPPCVSSNDAGLVIPIFQMTQSLMLFSRPC